MPLIAADNTLLLLSALVVLVAVGFAAEKTRWGRALSAPLFILFGAMLLSNVGVIPYSAPMYGTVSSVIVPMAIPMLLLRADLKKVFAESGPMLLAFTVAVVLTVVGAYVGAFLIDLGEYEAQITGVLAASYIGGSVNFVATSQAVEFNDSSTYVATLSADAVGAVLFLLLLMSLPALGFARRAMPSRFIDAEQNEAIDPNAHLASDDSSFDLPKAINGLALSLLICAVSQGIVTLFNTPNLFIVIITMLALLVANFGKPLLKHVQTEFEIATFMMYVFFAVIGAGADLGQVLGAALPATLFLVVLILVHLGLLLVVGRLLRLDLAEVMVASNACILGPPTAAALAASRGWRELVMPGMLVGILGYSIGTFIGVGIYQSLV